MECPKCNSFSLEYENIVNDINYANLTVVDRMYCCSCEHNFTLVTKYKIEVISSEIIEDDE